MTSRAAATRTSSDETAVDNQQQVIREKPTYTKDALHSASLTEGERSALGKDNPDARLQNPLAGLSSERLVAVCSILRFNIATL